MVVGVLGLLVILVIGHGVIVWTLHVTWYCVVTLFLVLVDWDDLRPWMAALVGRIQGGASSSSYPTGTWWGIVRGIVTPGRFVGREWTSRSFVVAPSRRVTQNVYPILVSNNRRSWKPSSQTCSLWDLPPPVGPSANNSKKERTGSSSFVRPSEWSDETATHVAAIHYCFVMLQEEERVRAARKLQKQQQSRSNTTNANHNTTKSLNKSPGLVQEEITIPPMRPVPAPTNPTSSSAGSSQGPPPPFTQRRPQGRQVGSNLLRSPMDPLMPPSAAPTNPNPRSLPTRSDGAPSSVEDPTTTATTTNNNNNKENNILLGPILQSLDDYFSSPTSPSDQTKLPAADGQPPHEEEESEELIAEAIEMKVQEEEPSPLRPEGILVRNRSSASAQHDVSFSFSVMDEDDDGPHYPHSRHHHHPSDSGLLGYSHTASSIGTVGSTLSDGGGDASASTGTGDGGGGGMTTATSPTLWYANHSSNHHTRSYSRGSGGAGAAEEHSDVDLPWLDVGAKIGMQFLNSAHVHRAVVAKERFGASEEAAVSTPTAPRQYASSVPPNLTHHPCDSLVPHSATHGAVRSHTTITHAGDAMHPALSGTTTTTTATLTTPTTTAPSFPHNVLPTLQVVGAGSQQPQPSSTKLAKPIHPFWTSATAAAIKYEPSKDFEDNDDDDEEQVDDKNKMLDTVMEKRAPKEGFYREKREKQRTASTDDPVSSDISKPAKDTNREQEEGEEQVKIEPALSWSPVVTISTSEEAEATPSLPDTTTIEIERRGIHNNNNPNTRRDAVVEPCTRDHDAITKNVDLPPQSRRTHIFSSWTRGKRSTGESNTFAAGQKNGVAHPSKPLTPRKRREPLAAGVKVAVPLFPFQPHTKLQQKQEQRCGGRSRINRKRPYQMGTVVSSERIFVKEEGEDDENATNCLSVTVQLDKSFLRNGEFAELTFRVMDSWLDDRYMPAHSKAPVGSCVATMFGLGVLVGWRVEDDCHLVRSLWQRRGPGASCAYLNRDAIHCVMEASVGFHVQTKFGAGLIVAYVDSGGQRFDKGRFLVSIQEEGRQHCGQVVELYRPDILECPGAQFIPVIEHIREAAHFQIQVDNYQAALREQQLRRIDRGQGIGGDGSEHTEDEDDEDGDMIPTTSQTFWQTGSAWAEILWNSFLKAVEEDEGDAVDSWLNDLIQGIVVFLERLDEHPSTSDNRQPKALREEKKEADADDHGRGKSNAEDENNHLRKPSFDTSTVVSGDFEIELVASDDNNDNSMNEGDSKQKEAAQSSEPGLWLLNDIFGGVFSSKSSTDKNPSTDEGSQTEQAADKNGPSDRDVYYNRLFAVMRTLMKTISIARVASVEHPHLRLALAIVYDFFMFCRTFLKVQRRNVSNHSIKIWNRAFHEASSTFGPIHERLEKIGQGIAQRMETQGRRAKARLLKFADALLGDERLLFALEQGDWDRCAIRLEYALVRSRIIEKENLVYYRKAASFVHRHWKLIITGDAISSSTNDGNKSGAAAARNNEKLALFAKFVQWIAAPRRSLLKLFERNDVLEVFERILVRVFHKKEEMTSSRMLAIHASNFHSLRHLRLLKDFSTSGRRLWMPVLDAADEEFAWLVSQLPFGETSKDFMVPLSNLFSLCVAHFHKIDRDLTTDWMDFLLEDEAVQIIHDIDTKLILAVESFARDVKEMMLILPYYSSIDDDLLGLMDEVDLDEFLREASEAMEDEEKLNEFIREKATIAIERFLNYLPRMSIPVEKRELMEGWVLTCRGEDGGDLTLSDVKVQRENLVCQILGGDALFFPMFGGQDGLDIGSSSETVAHRSPLSSPSHVSFLGSGSVSGGVVEESSVLDHIRDLLLQAQTHGCWKQGVGGIAQPPSDRYVASVLQNLPVSNVLNCGIELWRNLEIDDDELLEIAVRDVSYQIQLQKEREEKEAKQRGEWVSSKRSEDASDVPSTYIGSVASSSRASHTSSMHRKVHEFPTSPQVTSFDSKRKRFNPRVDPTVFFLEMRNLTLNLDKFRFRIEKSEQSRTLLDPVFDGKGSLLIQNVSIRLRIECAKERMRRTTALLGESFIPILVLRELTTSLEKVDLKVKDTGFGSDWLVNKAVEAFADDITKVVAENLREQILQQVKTAIENLNSYFLVNPNMLLNLLGISMEDLDDQIVWV